MKVYNQEIVVIEWTDFYKILMLIPLSKLISLFVPDTLTERIWKAIKPIPPITKKQAIISKIYYEYQVRLRPVLDEEWKRI